MQRSIYERPQGKPRRMVAPKQWSGELPAALLAAPTPLMIDKATECHVTPPKVAANMFYYLDLREGHTLLEPSAGTGNLVAAMADRGHDPTKITAVERHVSLYEAVCKRFEGQGVEVVSDCFLEWASGGLRQFDRIVMNPPFKRVKQHVAAAEAMLAPNGVLVALVPITFKHLTAELEEELPVDTFGTAKVYTKIIRIERAMR